MPGGTGIIEAGNRGLRYGEGLFETLKFKNNQFQLLKEHLERLWRGLLLLKFEIPTLFTPQYISQQLLLLLQKNKHTHARVRLTVVKGNGGLYDAANHVPHFIIESWPLEENFGQVNSNGMQLCIFPHALKSCDAFSNLKHNNFLPYSMGALFAKEKKCNDAIILNQHNRVCDSTIANIFIIKNGHLQTPALPEGCIAGTMRQFLIQELPGLGLPVQETMLTQQMLSGADEIFLTNAMTPVKWVQAIEDHSFQHEQTFRIYQQLCKTFPDLFC